MNQQPSSSEDPLETLLRKPSKPLADDGFFTRVLAALPPPTPKPRRLPNRRAIACGLGAFAGTIWTLAYSETPRVDDITILGAQLMTTVRTVADVFTDRTVIVLVALILGSLVVAFFHEIAAKFD